MKETNNKDLLIGDYIEDIDKISNELIDFLEDCNISLSIKDKSKSFKYLVSRLNEIIAIRKDRKYYAVQLDENGYIISLSNVDGILQEQELPEDILRGYYIYEDGKFVLDERKKLEWR